MSGNQPIDTPAYISLSHLHLSYVSHTLRYVDGALRGIVVLREKGEGTAEASLLERVASDAVAVHHDAIKAWEQKFKEIVGNRKDKPCKIEAAVREKLDSQRSEWATNFYIGKMRDTLKDAETEVVEKEMKEMREALRQAFKEKAKMTQKEVHKMLLDEEGG